MHTTLNDGPTSREIQELPAKVHILLVGLVFVVAKHLYQLPSVVQNDHPGHVGVALSKKACYKSTKLSTIKSGDHIIHYPNDPTTHVFILLSSSSALWIRL